jgi:hypothetical protein
MLDLWKRQMVMLAPDGGGSGDGSGTGDASGQGKPGNGGEGAAGANDGEKPDGSEGKPPERAFTQAEVDQIVKDRLERERKKAADDAKKSKDATDAQALKEQAKWQELAEKHEARVKELETALESGGKDLEAQAGQTKRFEAALQKFLDEQRKGLPAHIVSLLDKLDAVDQLEYIAANAETLRKTPGGVPPTPGADGDSKLTPEERRKRSYRVRL